MFLNTGSLSSSFAARGTETILDAGIVVIAYQSTAISEVRVEPPTVNAPREVISQYVFVFDPLLEQNMLLSLPPPKAVRD